jgi:hypothetical protein
MMEMCKTISKTWGLKSWGFVDAYTKGLTACSVPHIQAVYVVVEIERCTAPAVYCCTAGWSGHRVTCGQYRAVLCGVSLGSAPKQAEAAQQ